jgi:hypothetical protein
LITKRRVFILDGEGEREQHVFLSNVVVLKKSTYATSTIMK